MEQADLFKANPPPTSSNMKGFVGKFYTESPFLLMHTNPQQQPFDNFNNMGAPMTPVSPMTDFSSSPPNNEFYQSLEAPSSSTEDLQMAPTGQTMPLDNPMGTIGGAPMNPFEQTNNTMNMNNNMMQNNMMPYQDPSMYDPNNFYYNDQMMLQQMMFEQQMMFNQQMDEVRLRASFERDTLNEENFITSVCYDKCIHSYMINPIHQAEKFKNVTNEFEHLSSKEMDCMKHCVRRQKEFANQILHRITNIMTNKNK